MPSRTGWTVAPGAPRGGAGSGRSSRCRSRSPVRGHHDRAEPGRRPARRERAGPRPGGTGGAARSRGRRARARAAASGRRAQEQFVSAGAMPEPAVPNRRSRPPCGGGRPQATGGTASRRRPGRAVATSCAGTRRAAGRARVGAERRGPARREVRQRPEHADRGGGHRGRDAADARGPEERSRGAGRGEQPRRSTRSSPCSMARRISRRSSRGRADPP